MGTAAGLQDLDVERVRVLAERLLAPRATNLPLWMYSGRTPASELRRRRRELSSQALLLTEEVAPTVHAMIESSRLALGIDLDVEAYQIGTALPGHWNARCMGYDDRVVLSLDGQLLLLLDEASQRCVVGHELGHYLAHMKRPVWFRSTEGRHALSENEDRAFRLATELTADRFGLLVGRDLDAALRVEMASASHLPVGALGWSPRAYLAQSQRTMEELVENGETVEGSTHPEHGMRAYALWLFSETDLYKALTGEGPGTRMLRAVEARIAQLLGVHLRQVETSPDAPEPSPERPIARKYAPLMAAPDDDATEPEAPGWIDPLRPPMEALKDATTRAKQTLSDLARKTLSAAVSAPVDDEPEAAEDPFERALLERFAELERRTPKA